MKRHEHLIILRGDNRETLWTRRAESVQCVVTSPPYWSVRDYETPAVDFPETVLYPSIGLPPIIAPAWSGQLGLEPDPWHFVAHLVATFGVVGRVLRSDGTLWVNMGDTYYTGSGVADGTKPSATRRKPKKIGHHTTPNRMPLAGYKPKDLVGIPWMFAKAMQAHGWTLRADIIWHKPNQIPGSQKDRPTVGHEYLFLFSRSESYFYDNVAIHEAAGAAPAGATPAGWETAGDHRSLKGRHSNGGDRVNRTTREKRTVWSIPSSRFNGAHFATFPPDLVRPCILAGTSERGACPDCGAAWQRLTEEVPIVEPDTVIPTLFGDEVVKKGTRTEIKTTGWRPRCICGSDPALALKHDDLETFETPTGEQLGEDESVQRGRRGIGRDAVNVGKRLITKYEHRKYAEQISNNCFRHEMSEEASAESGADAFEHYLRTDRHGARPVPPEILERWISSGWLARVTVPEWNYPRPVPCVVADPFAGSGTVGEVAIETGRKAILCEIAEHYWPLIERRTEGAQPPLPL